MKKKKGRRVGKRKRSPEKKERSRVNTAGVNGRLVKRAKSISGERETRRNVEEKERQDGRRAKGRV